MVGIINSRNIKNAAFRPRSNTPTHTNTYITPTHTRVRKNHGIEQKVRNSVLRDKNKAITAAVYPKDEKGSKGKVIIF